MSTKTHLVTFMDGNEGKAVSDAIKSQSKYVSGFVGFWNRLVGGQDPLTALAGGIGLAPTSLKQQYRNNGVDPNKLNQNFGEAISTTRPANAAQANELLASAEDQSKGGVIPTWALWGIGLLGVLTLAPGALGRVGRGRVGRGRSFRMARFSRPRARFRFPRFKRRRR